LRYGPIDLAQPVNESRRNREGVAAARYVLGNGEETRRGSDTGAYAGSNPVVQEEPQKAPSRIRKWAGTDEGPRK
jgi:hypothetical protein